MEKQILNFVFISVCSFLLFISCSSEDSINDSHYTQQCNVTTRYSSVGWGIARCTIKGRTVFIEWNFPTASEKPSWYVVHVTLKLLWVYRFIWNFRRRNGRNKKLWTPYFLHIHSRWYTLARNKGWGGLPVTLQLTSIDIDEYSGQSSSEPKCDHNFDFRDTSITVGLDLSNRQNRRVYWLY